MWDKFRIALFHTVSWMARLILLLLVTVMPWWYGGAQWQAQWWTVVGGMALAILTWAATLLSPRRTGGFVHLSLVMVLFLGWTSLELVPLPQFMASQLSGAGRFVKSIVEQTDVTSEKAWLQPESYNQVSIAPLQTKASIAVYAVAIVVLWSASTLFVSKKLALTLVITLAAGGVANAGLGLVQLVGYSHEPLLLTMPAEGRYFATFVSRNSAPAYYASTCGACLAILGLTYRTQKRKRRKDYRVTYPGDSWVGRLRNRLEDVFIDLNSAAVTCVLAIAFMLLVTLATFSRGGILGCLAACAVTLCLTLGGRGASFTAALVLSSSMLLVIGGLLTLFQLNEPIYSRLDQINTSVDSTNDTRWIVWGYTLKAFPTYALAGCGLGTYRFALQPFHTAGPNVWFHHAENVPLEVLLETGLPGFLIAAYAVFIVLRQLTRHSRLQKEYMLLAAAIYATCAIGVQAIVDFSLFLPGIFLPYCALLGAFFGRTRRIEHEMARSEELGEAAHDARTASKLPAPTPTPGKAIGHSLIATTALAGMLLGLPSLTGYSIAERLGAELDKLSVAIENRFKVDAADNASLNLDKLAEAYTAIQESAADAVVNFEKHPEVALVVGRVEQLLWRVDAANTLDWGNEPENHRWLLANPQVLSSIVRMKDPTVSGLQKRIRNHQLGMELAGDSLERMQWALAGCPQDARAAWGCLSADCDWLSPLEYEALLELLSRVTGNNAQVMIEVGIVAIREGSVSRGIKLVKRALTIDWTKMNVNNLSSILRYVDEEQLRAILPDDLIKAAMVAELTSKLANDPVEPLPQAAPIAAALTSRVYSQIIQAQPKNLGEYRALLWVVDQKQDLAAKASLLRSMVFLSPSDFGLQFELGNTLLQAGRPTDALAVFKKLRDQDDRTAVIWQCAQKIEECEQQIKIVAESMVKPH